MTDYTTKVCTKCKRELPATPEYFQRQSRNKDGLTSQCKDCRRAYYQANRTEIRKKHKAYYEANKEQINDERRERYHSDEKYKREILERAAQWREENAEYKRELDRQYRETNRESLRQRKQEEYYRHQDDYIRRARDWWGVNKDEVNKRRRTEKHRRYTRELRRRNPHVYRAIKVRRRARENNLPCNYTTDDWQRSLEYFNGCCAVCGRQLNDMFGEFKSAADHWIPISYEGDDNPGTVPENIVPLCHGFDGCNNLKSDKMPDVWLIETYGARKAKQILERVNAYFEWVSNQ